MTVLEPDANPSTLGARGGRVDPGGAQAGIGKHCGGDAVRGAVVDAKHQPVEAVVTTTVAVHDLDAVDGQDLAEIGHPVAVDHVRRVREGVRVAIDRVLGRVAAVFARLPDLNGVGLLGDGGRPVRDVNHSKEPHFGETDAMIAGTVGRGLGEADPERSGECVRWQREHDEPERTGVGQ